MRNTRPAHCMAAMVIAVLLTATPAFAADQNVALVLGVKGSPFYQALACGAKAKARELGLQLTVSAPDQFAADSQIPVVNAVAATRPAVAAVVPTDTQALIEPLRQLHQRGTRVITVDQTINDTSFVASRIQTDNEAGGRLAADAINTLLGGKGKVLTITQPPGSAAQDAREAGFRAELKRFPGIVYLGPQYQSDDPQKAAEIVTSTLSAHPDLAGIFATNDQGAIGTVTGLRQAGGIGRVKVVAYDAASAEVNALKNGSIQTLIAQTPKEEGEAAMQAAAALMQGKPVDKVILTHIVTIKAGDTATADRYEYRGNCP